MDKVARTIAEILNPKKDLRKRSWIVKRGGKWFTVTVELGDKLND